MKFILISGKAKSGKTVLAKNLKLALPSWPPVHILESPTDDGAILSFWQIQPAGTLIVCAQTEELMKTISFDELYCMKPDYQYAKIDLKSEPQKVPTAQPIEVNLQQEIKVIPPSTPAGPTERDIELVIRQTCCDRDTAISALKDSYGDVVAAIEYLLQDSDACTTCSS